MAIECECPACYESMRLEHTSTGKMVRCGVCQHKFRAPGTPVASDEVVEPPAKSTPPKIKAASPSPRPPKAEPALAKPPRDEPEPSKRPKAEPVERDRPAPCRRRPRPAPESRDTTGFWVLITAACVFLVAVVCVGGYVAYTVARRAPGPAVHAPDPTQDAARDEAMARQRVEDAQQVAEVRRAEQKRQQEEDQAKEKAHAAALEKLRDEFRTAGRAAPDPYVIPGLVLHIGFDGPDHWPGAAGQLAMIGGTKGPGPRGSALYVTAGGRAVLWYPSDWLRTGASESVTVAGWVKLRFRPVTLLQVDGMGRNALGHISVTGRRVVLDTARGPDPAAEEPDGSRVSATWERDDQWHHVAAVRERRQGGERAVVYLDGKPIADTLVPPGAEWSTATSWTFAQTIEPTAGTWPGPTGPPGRDGNPARLREDEIAFAVDEICLYERALTPAEVRVLAGIDPVPADLKVRERPIDPTTVARSEVKLTEAHKFNHYPSGVVFDASRATAWAVTGGMTPTSSHLIKLSYPEFKPIEWFLLEGAPGPVALDPVENRLFVVLQDKGKLPGPQPDVRQGGWRVGYGAIHRYDLDGLPRGGSEAGPPVVKPAATAPLPLVNPATALAITPDGRWVCAALQYKSDKGVTTRVFRIPSDLESAAEHLTGPGLGDTPFPYRLAIPAGSSAVWFSTTAGDGKWAAVEVATRREVARPSLQPASAVRRDWAVHPAGDRMYLVNDDGGVDEVKVVDGQAGVRRPLVVGKWRPLADYGHLAATEDGRYVFFASPFNTGGDLTVVDTAGRRARPEASPQPSLTMRYFHGPLWLSPDGAVVVSSRGQAYRVSYPPGAAPAVRPPTPRPKREVALAPPPRPSSYTRSVPPPSEFPGLKFHLAFDEDAGPGVKESVSGKVVGKLLDGQYVDGVRGKALRLTFDPKVKDKVGRLNLADQKGIFRIGADTPFTLTMWVRPVKGTGFPFQARRRIDKNRSLTLDISAYTAPGWQSLRANLGDLSSSSTVPHQRWGHGVQIGEWQHLAIVRDGRGAVRFLVNGVEANRFSGNGRFEDELDFETVELSVPSGQEPSTLDIDELCLFDQLLTDEQLLRLAAVRGSRELRPTETGPAAAAPVRPADITRDAAPSRPYAGGPVPVATELKGLAFYLPLTTLQGGKTPEAVSITDVTVAGAELVDGVRGKALRVTPQATGAGADLSGTAALKVPAGKPFTLATWVRVLNTDRADNPVVLGVTGDGPQPTREFVLAVGKGGVELRLGDRTAQARPGIRIAGPCPEPGRWVHLAVTRDEGGRVRLLVDAAEVVPKGEPIFPHELGYDRVRLAGGPPRTPLMDLAEFSFFHRALTDAEVKRLAGAK
jgi:hypothetical protein